MALDDSTAGESVLAHARGLVAQGDLLEARGVLKEHLARIDPSTAREIDDMLKCKHLLGFVLHQLGDLHQAKVVQSDLVDYLKDNFGLDNDTGDIALANLAGTLCALSEFDPAIGVWREIIQIRRGRYGENSASTLRAISSLSDIQRRVGKFAEARVIDSDVLARATDEGLEARFILDVKRNILKDLVGLREWSEAAVTAEELYNSGVRDLDVGDELRLHLEQNDRKFKWIRRANRRNS